MKQNLIVGYANVPTLETTVPGGLADRLANGIRLRCLNAPAGKLF